jgi:hypothetical protein
MNRRIYFFLLAVFMIFSSAFLSGCKKYVDGPVISFSSREARVINDWKAVLISKNDIDIASDFEFIHMNFRENGVFEWFFKLTGDPTDYQFEGKNPSWELASLDEEIKISYFDENVGDDRLLYFNILRLAEDELWITYIDNGDRMGLRLSPK